MKDAVSAIKFYQQAFGAKLVGQISMPDGTVGHAELQIGDSKFMLAEEMPAWGNKNPATGRFARRYRTVCG
ncbi:MAG: VOC family protein [Gallionella sp.]